MSNMAGINSIQTRRFPKYNLPFHYDNILSGQMGRLIPVQCDEVNAGERWTQNVNFVMRMAPLIHPAMTQLDVHFYSFFVPTRIITPRNSAQSTWEKMIESINKPSSEQPILPSIYTSDSVHVDDVSKVWIKERFGLGTLSEYLDLIGLTNEQIDEATSFYIPFEHRLNIAGLLCYLYIYNYWFRRDQIEPEITMPLSLGAIDLANIDNSDYVKNEEWTRDDLNGHADFRNWITELFKLRYKNYERDYFTSSLPSPQYGEDVTLGEATINIENQFANVSGLFPLYAYRQEPPFSPFGTQGFLRTLNDGRVTYAGAYDITDKLTSVSSENISASTTPWPANAALMEIPAPSAGQPWQALRADLGDIEAYYSGFTINEFRLAMQMQAVCEVINRGGTRYVEIMQNVYDSIVPDARLQQPVFLGGQKFPVQIGSVVQTSQTTDSSTLGVLGGKAQAANNGRLFRSKKKFDEAGYVMTIMCVVPRTGYMNGLPRKWMKKDVLDFFNPYFSHVGEQEVHNCELYFSPFDDSAYDYDTFGYQERYAEYRHPVSRVHGEMRGKSKKSWHLYREFDRTQNLNTDFIKMDVDDFTRIFQYEEIEDTQDEMFDMMLRFNIKKKTPVPKYGTPYSFI